jgi:hypothetical protein
LDNIVTCVLNSYFMGSTKNAAACLVPASCNVILRQTVLPPNPSTPVVHACAVISTCFIARFFIYTKESGSAEHIDCHLLSYRAHVAAKKTQVQGISTGLVVDPIAWPKA